MPLETGTYISDLDASNPLGADDRSQGDNHLRLIKSLAKSTFPNASKAFRFPNSGAVETGDFSVTFPTDQNKLYAIDSTALAITVSLPDPTSGGTPNEDGFGFWLLRSAGANDITVSPSGVQTIMGASSYTLGAIRQWAYFFWAGTTNTWYVFEGNNPAITYALNIVLAGTTPLVVRRTENDTSERVVASWRLGSGAGDVAADTLVGGGANDVLERRRYIGATEIERLTTALVKFFLNTQIGDNILLENDGYAELTEISAPSNPAANKIRAFVQDDSATTRFAVLDSAGTKVFLMPPPDRGYDEYDEIDDITGSGNVIALDDSIPQNDEGFEILSAEITLVKSNSRVRVRVQAFGVCVSNQLDDPKAWVIALFRDSGADALQAVVVGQNLNNVGSSQASGYLEFEEAPGAAGTYTYKVRVGIVTDTDTLNLNSNLVGRMFGGVAKATLVVEEVYV